MKRASMVAVLVALFATPLLADEGQVPQATLQALGLRGMQTMTDAEGKQVRGKVTFLSFSSTSLLVGQLYNGELPPNPGVNFVLASSANSASGSSDTASGAIWSQSATLGPASLFTLVPFYSGSFSGTAGGSGSIFFLP
jgi:hypothetical protein